MLTLSRTKTVAHELLGEEVAAVISLPTAVEWAEAVTDKADNLELVRRFVRGVSSPGIEELAGGVTGAELVELPQTFQLVMGLGADVIAAAMPSEASKNG